MNRLIRHLLKNKDAIFIAAMLALMSASFFPFYTGEAKQLAEHKESVILALFMAVSVMAFLMVRFLSGSSQSSEKIEIYRYELEHLRHKLKNQVSKQASPVSLEDEKRITDEIFERLKYEVSASYLENLKNEIKASEYRLDIFKRGKSTLDRIYKEIDALGRRGTVNLVLGVITALSGVVTLSFFVLPKEGAHSSLSEFAMDFLPRLSIVLIIEVFSYFFLRLYKASLSEIKYFQNEATNIEHSFVALEAAISINDKNLIEKCVHAFLEIERNPILAAGQTSREIIQVDQSLKETQFSTEALVKIIDALRKNSKD